MYENWMSYKKQRDRNIPVPLLRCNAVLIKLVILLFSKLLKWQPSTPLCCHLWYRCGCW